MLTDAAPHKVSQDDLPMRFTATRELSLGLVAPLSEADATAQSMPDTSPAKWHLAHTTWFFETFVLRDFVSDYRPYDERWAYLFNSYYEAEGARHPRPQRGLLTRPGLGEIRAWRAAVDEALLDALPTLDERARHRIVLGIQHEQQHQELLLTDILHLLHANPLLPAMWDAPRAPARQAPPEPIRWLEGRHGIVEIGADSDQSAFSFDCEGPRHPVFVTPHVLADRLITNGEWRDFIADGGYQRPEFWLSDGWAWVQAEDIRAPLYWRRDDDADAWATFAHDGPAPLEAAAPVTHVSYYEADAFARWAGARLPTEAEWEAAASSIDPLSGNQLDAAAPPRPHPAPAGAGLRQMFGDVWQWTGSAYLPYPGFRAAPGAVGEYNGKFMSGQFVLRGASCATPRSHSRATYRNFFYPHQRWQFTGVRLAKDV